MLVFAPWGILVLKELITTKKISSIYHFLLSLLICIFVFAPWQIYTLTNFPKEAKYEMYFNALHLTQVVENHAGNALYYISNFDLYFGKNIFLFLIFGILFLIFSKKIKCEFHFILIFCFVFVTIFFSLIVQTKIQSYYYIIVPIGIVYAGMGIYYFLNTIIKNNVLLIVFSILIVFYTCNPFHFFNDTKQIHNFNSRAYNDSIYRNLHHILPDEYKIVMNVRSPEQIDLMFYNNDIAAIHFSIEEKYMNELAIKKTKIATFMDHSASTNPDYIMKYPYLYAIPVELK